MAVTTSSRLLASQLTVVVVLAVLSHQTVTGQSTTKTMAQPRKSGELQKQDHSLTDQERVALQQYLKAEEIERRCDLGTFLHQATLACESCDEYCPNGENLNACGLRCEVYYQNSENIRLRKKVGDLERERHMQASSVVYIWVTIVALATVTATFVVLLLKRQREDEKQRVSLQNDLKKKIEDLELRMRGCASNDMRPLQRLNGAVPIPIEDNQQRNDQHEHEQLIADQV